MSWNPEPQNAHPTNIAFDEHAKGSLSYMEGGCYYNKMTKY